MSIITTNRSSAMPGRGGSYSECEPSVKYLGHIVSKEGIQIKRLLFPAWNHLSVSDLRRFMGLVNQLGKFSSKIAEISQPLRELLRKGRACVWGPSQEKSFAEIKLEMVTPTVLAQ